MTDKILQSDIELAQRLMHEQRNDEEIIAALVRRRLNPDKVRQLVAALRSGARIEPELPIDYKTVQGALQQTVNGTNAETPAAESTHTHRRRTRSNSGKGWIVLLIIVVAAAAVVAFLLAGSKSKPATQGFEPPPAQTDFAPAPGSQTGDVNPQTPATPPQPAQKP